MARKLCELCGGLVVKKNGQEPPLTMFGCVRCWCCYDDVSERIEPPPERYESGARCKVCGVKLPAGRRCGRCELCQKDRRREVRRGYMRGYMRKRRRPGQMEVVR